ncbi:MAG: hypothetical protein ABI600_12620 [Luteolibacter sp.]
MSALSKAIVRSAFRQSNPSSNPTPKTLDMAQWDLQTVHTDEEKFCNHLRLKRRNRRWHRWFAAIAGLPGTGKTANIPSCVRPPDQGGQMAYSVRCFRR